MQFYMEDRIEVLKSPKKLAQFINEVLNGERSLYWESLRVKPTKFSERVVGEDFEKKVIESDKDVLLLVHHPLNHKNRGLKERFNSFAEAH